MRRLKVGKMTISIDGEVASTQATNCVFCLHISSTAIYFQHGDHNLCSGRRLELFTPFHRFRYSSGQPWAGILIAPTSKKGGK